jgi:hypothetical protein
VLPCAIKLMEDEEGKVEVDELDLEFVTHSQVLG